MAEQNGDLARLAGLAATVSEERRRLLEGQLPLSHNPRFDAGVAVGLVRASEIVAEQQGEEAARPLQEIAAVAAARAGRAAGIRRNTREIHGAWCSSRARGGNRAH